MSQVYKTPWPLYRIHLSHHDIHLGSLEQIFHLVHASFPLEYPRLHLIKQVLQSAHGMIQLLLQSEFMLPFGGLWH